jgi:hypothetical protein
VTKKVCIGTRVVPQRVEELDSLRDLYPGAEGAPTSRSDLLRAVLDLALPVVAEPVLRRRLQALARGRRTIGDVFREALLRGLDTMEATR